MATRTFTSMTALENAIEAAIKEAVEATAKTAQEEFTKCIDEQYYKDPGFYPNVYQRTGEFLKSAAYKMMSSNSAEIYIDVDGMHYRTGFDPWQVVSWASESKHGADYYQTSTMDFWTRFIEWCNENLISTLKLNLRKHGISAM